MKKFLIIIILNTVFFLKTGRAFVLLPSAELIKTDKFRISFGINEYYKRGDLEGSGSVLIIPFNMQLGLARKVEFLGLFPYIQLRQKYIAESDTFGDIIIYLKFDIKKFAFLYPEFIGKILSYNYFDFITGFNIATGPTKQENRDFEKYSTGLPDWRVGFIYGHYLKDFTLDLSFIYVFASFLGEDYLPFSSEIFSSSKKSYFFDIHKVIVKFLWPGRYPWAEKDAPLIEKYPHADDYFMLNLVASYSLYPEFTLFNYNFFLQFDWQQSFHNKLCLKQTELLITPGIQVYLSEITTITGAISIPLDYKKRDYYFDAKYFIGLTFLL